MHDQLSEAGIRAEPQLTGLLTEAEFAEEILKRPPSTARKLRVSGLGPPVVWIGSFPHYRPAAIEKWLAEQEQPPTLRTFRHKPRPKQPTVVNGGVRRCEVAGCGAAVVDQNNRGRRGPKRRFCEAHATPKSRRAAQRAA